MAPAPEMGFMKRLDSVRWGTSSNIYNKICQVDSGGGSLSTMFTEWILSWYSPYMYVWMNLCIPGFIQLSANAHSVTCYKLRKITICNNSFGPWWPERVINANRAYRTAWTIWRRSWYYCCCCCLEWVCCYAVDIKSKGSISHNTPCIASFDWMTFYSPRWSLSRSAHN